MRPGDLSQALTQHLWAGYTLSKFWDSLRPSFLEVDGQSSGEPPKLNTNYALCVCRDYQHFGTIQSEHREHCNVVTTEDSIVF